METISSRNRNSGINYIAFFDLDGTIIRANSGKELILYAYKKGFVSLTDLMKGIYLSLLYRFEFKDTVNIINSMVSWLKGVSVSGLISLSEEICRDRLINSICPEIEKEIIFHKKNGGMVVILSSAIMPVCKIIADHLLMDDVICSALESRNGIFTGYPEGSLCFGEEKVTRLTEFCNKNNIAPHNSWYYGDSIADLHALTSVGIPVCVNPDKKLLRAAGKRGWKVILSEKVSSN
jgi:putative phosphoserine phosphatase/1-acylglycerol-3-phosphate O-acyltransferase